MRDIKTRESRAGSVKTIDRASMLSYRMKQATIRGKEQAAGSVSRDEQNETSYAEERTMYMADNSVSAAGSMAESGYRRGKEFVKKTISDRKLMREAEAVYGKQPYMGYESRNPGRIVGAYRRETSFGSIEGKNAITRGRASEMKPEGGFTGPSRIRINKPRVKGTESDIIGKPATLNPLIKAEKAETVMKRQYQMKKARDAVRKRAEKTGKGFLVAVRKAVESTKFIVGSLSVAGSIALIAIIVCTFFGSAFYILGDESNPDYIPGDFVGVGNEAIVEVAAAQVGNVGGRPYWSWYGFYDRVEWCACFVSWCANKCGYIEDGIIPKFAVVGHGMSWFRNRDQWQGRGYHPKPGDIIFFDWDGDGLGNHVGIVESSDDTYVYTIEGNSGDKCCRRTYFISSSMIMGYGIPAYPVPEAVDADEKILGKM